MFIAMNRFRVLRGQEQAFEAVWLERDTQLAGVPGFVAFHLRAAWARRPKIANAVHVAHRLELARSFRGLDPLRGVPRRAQGRGRQKAALPRPPAVRGVRGHPGGAARLRALARLTPAAPGRSSTALPLAATLAAMASFQAGASRAKGLFPAIGPEGAATLRLCLGALDAAGDHLPVARVAEARAAHTPLRPRHLDGAHHHAFLPGAQPPAAGHRHRAPVPWTARGGDRRLAAADRSGLGAARRRRRLANGEGTSRGASSDRFSGRRVRHRRRDRVGQLHHCRARRRRGVRTFYSGPRGQHRGACCRPDRPLARGLGPVLAQPPAARARGCAVGGGAARSRSAGSMLFAGSRRGRSRPSPAWSRRWGCCRASSCSTSGCRWCRSRASER